MPVVNKEEVIVAVEKKSEVKEDLKKVLKKKFSGTIKKRAH